MKAKMTLSALAAMALFAGCENYDYDRDTDDDGINEVPSATPPRDTTTDPTSPTYIPPATNDRPTPGTDITVPRTGERDPMTPPLPPGTGDTGASATLTAEEREFVTSAASGGLFEVQSAEIALEQELDPQLQQTAQMIMRDHQAANQELRSLAQRKGLAVPMTMQPKHQEMLDQLRDQQGDLATAFRDVQVKAHEEAIALFEQCATTAKDPDIKAFAEKHLPTLKKHLQMLRGESTQPSDMPDDMPEQPGQQEPGA